MERYYVYCNSNQVYHALINNSILSKALTDSSFSAATASFLSDSYIFITKEVLTDEVAVIGASDEYFPVVLEIEDDPSNSIIPVRFAIKQEEVIVEQKVSKLGDYAKKEGCYGAFVYGEIPISFVSAIRFQNESDKLNFRKSSPDLWFPKEMFVVSEGTEVVSSVSKEDIERASTLVAEGMGTAEGKQLEEKIIERNKEKAINYFAIEATNRWQIRNVKCNIDSYLINRLDNDDKDFEKIAKETFETEKAFESGYSFQDVMEAKDSVLDKVEEDVNTELFEKAIGFLKKSTTLDSDDYEKLSRCLYEGFDANISGEIEKALQVIKEYVYERALVDPDDVFKALDEYPVLKALALFLDMRDNADYLRNACEKKLNCYEKRYAYMMFAAYHGMKEVDGKEKKHRLLERKLESVAFKDYHDDMLISEVLSEETSTFIKDPERREDAKAFYGIVPEFQIWYDQESSKERLLSLDDKDLEKLYKEVSTKNISSEEMYALSESIKITISIGDIKETLTIESVDDIDTVLKKEKRKLNSLVKKQSVFQGAKFKEYIEDPKIYSRLFNRNKDLIQSYCRKVK